MTNERTPAWRLLFLLLSAFAMTALLLAAACGGDDDDDGGDDTSATATEDSGDDGGDDGGDDEEPTETEDTGDDGGDDAISELQDLAGSGENATGVITYTFSTGGDESSWTIYTEGDKSRTDFGDESGNFISITTPDGSYTCTESGGDGFCYEGEGGVGSNPFAGLLTQYGSSDSIFAYLELFTDADVESSSEEIAGVDASCYTASGDFTGDSGTIKWCFSDSGLLLVSSYELASGTFEMRATEYSEDVPDDAFEPPYEVTVIPGQ